MRYDESRSFREDECLAGERLDDLLPSGGCQPYRSRPLGVPRAISTIRLEELKASLNFGRKIFLTTVSFLPNSH